MKPRFLKSILRSACILTGLICLSFLFGCTKKKSTQKPVQPGTAVLKGSPGTSLQDIKPNGSSSQDTEVEDGQITRPSVPAPGSSSRPPPANPSLVIRPRARPKSDVNQKISIESSKSLQTQQVIYHGIDISPIADFFLEHSRLVKRPFYLYHWSSSRARRNSSDAQKNSSIYGRDYLRQTSLGFLRGLSQPNRLSAGMMGPGLYAAIDPTVTEEYGGGEDWSLLEMKNPPAARIIDLSNPVVPGENIRLLLSQFRCPTGDLMGMGLVYELFASNDLDAECVSLLRYVLEDLFKIDAFTYSYSGTPYRECRLANGKALDRGMAFVIISDHWASLSQAEVQVYSSRTRAKLVNRISIESVFYANSKVLLEDLNRQGYKSKLASAAILKISKERYPSYKNRDLQIYELEPTLCRGGSSCVKVNLAYLDEAHNVRSNDLTFNFPMADIPEPDISAGEYPAKVSSSLPPLGHETLHWSDLDGRSTLPNVKAWMQENLLRCGATEHLGLLGTFD